ncbi:glycosyltransferase family 25 protein [Dongia rigui]|uniref:Glycosyltransferase family 25 protein n=1 Tax=Dongia rigui TaxID=940149 RepID=A0ABU5E061_9PROT|nr:glycosyltransferase family 25 protein [Dongia rigui]
METAQSINSDGTAGVTGQAPQRTKVLVVSMADALDRQHRFSDRASAAVVPWRFFSAYSKLHPHLVYDETEALLAHGRPLRPGELGCYSSHYAIWEQLVADDDADQYVVLEDDVIVDWEYLKKIIDADLSPMKIDYLRLYYKYPVRQIVLMNAFVDRSRSLVELSDFAYGTQGYLITKAAAVRLLMHCRVVRRPIDDELDRSWAHGVRNLSVFPFPLIEESGASTIGASRFEKYPMPAHLRVRRRIHRFVERMRLRKAKAIRRLRHAFAN